MESTKSLTTVNRIRGTLKTKSSRIKTFLENFQQPESEAETRIILESKLELICDIKNSIKELFIQYAELPDATEISQAVAVLEEVEVETEQSEVSLKILLSKLKSPVNNVNNTVNNLPEPNDSKPPALKFTLPQIPLETFSGNVLNFQSFKQQFMSIIGQNNDLTEVQKLYYLKASLKGDVKLLESCQDTYESLWATLEARFENKRAVVNAHANNILNYAKLSESPTQLRLFIDSVKGNLRALKLLDLERNTLSDTLLLNVLVSKLPQETRKEYEFTIKTNNLPSLDDFIEFLELRTRVLDSLTKANYFPSKNNTSGFFPKTTPASAHQKTRSLLINNSKSNKQLCTMPNCSEFHPLFRCNKFKALNIQERIEHVKKFRYCLNCLSSSHSNVTKCLSDKFCGFCGNGNKHNSLLRTSVSDQISQRNDIPTQSAPAINIEASKEHHSDDVRSAKVTGSRGESNLTFVTRDQPADALERERSCFDSPDVTLFSEGSERNQKNVILNTAIVYLTGADNKRYGFRSILDCGSTNSFISAQAANLLNLRKQRVYVPISGLNETALYVKSQICTKLSNENDDENWDINLLIVPKITSVTPSRYINCENLKIPKNIKLADKNFHIPAPVHVLLSTEHFFEFLRDGKIHVENSNLILKNTCFGHVISGSVTLHSPPSVKDQTANRVTLHSPPSIKDQTANQCFLSMNMSILNKTTASFSEVEEVNEDYSTPSNELQYCHKHFEQLQHIEEIISNSNANPNEGTAFYQDCQECLCETYVNAHHRVRVTKDHVVRPKEEMEGENAAMQSQKYLLCPVHSNEHLKLYCETCDKLTCRNSQLSDHKAHKYQFLKNACDEEKDNIAELLSKIKEKQGHRQEASNNLNKRHEEIVEQESQISQEIQVFSVKFITDINKRANALLQDLNEVCTDKKALINFKSQELKSVSEWLKHCQKFADAAMALGSETALVYSKKLIMNQLRRILRHKCDTPNPNHVVVIQFAYETNFLSQYISNLGQILVDQQPLPGSANASGMLPMPQAISQGPVPHTPPMRQVSQMQLNQRATTPPVQQINHHQLQPQIGPYGQPQVTSSTDLVRTESPRTRQMINNQMNFRTCRPVPNQQANFQMQANPNQYTPPRQMVQQQSRQLVQMRQRPQQVQQQPPQQQVRQQQQPQYTSSNQQLPMPLRQNKNITISTLPSPSGPSPSKQRAIAPRARMTINNHGNNILRINTNQVRQDQQTQGQPQVIVLDDNNPKTPNMSDTTRLTHFPSNLAATLAANPLLQMQPATNNNCSSLAPVIPQVSVLWFTAPNTPSSQTSPTLLRQLKSNTTNLMRPPAKPPDRVIMSPVTMQSYTEMNISVSVSYAQQMGYSFPLLNQNQPSSPP